MIDIAHSVIYVFSKQTEKLCRPEDADENLRTKYENLLEMCSTMLNKGCYFSE